MVAFGDTLLCLGIVSVMMLFPTMLALYFLRPYKNLWFAFAIACLVFALTGPAVEIANTAISASGNYNNPAADVLSLIGILHVFGAPLFLIGFIIFAVLAPAGRPRLLMLLSAGMEILTGIYVVVNLVLFSRFF